MSFWLQVIGLKGVMLLIVHPILELGASVCQTYTVYIYFNHSFINHDNILIPCTNNFDNVRKSTASERTPHTSHSNRPKCSVGRGDSPFHSICTEVTLFHY
jgi:hypothetical protein